MKKVITISKIILIPQERLRTSNRIIAYLLLGLFAFLPLSYPNSASGAECVNCDQMFASVKGGFWVEVIDENGGGLMDKAYVHAWADFVTNTKIRDGEFVCGDEPGEGDLYYWEFSHMRNDGSLDGWHQVTGQNDNGQINFVDCGQDEKYCDINAREKYPLERDTNYLFRWKVYCQATGQSAYFGYTTIIFVPPWDPPGCQRCAGGSGAGFCQHPVPRSVVFSPSPDLILKSPVGDLNISRIYNTSLLNESGIDDGMFGKGWWGSYQYQIQTYPPSGYNTALMLYDGEGRKTFYKRQYDSLSGSWTDIFNSQNGDGSYLTKLPDGSFTLRKTEGSIYTFNSEGRLTSIIDLNNNQIVVNYQNGRLSNVTDKLGRTITFDYGGTSYVRTIIGPSTVANPTGVYANFIQDARGNLVRVDYPDGHSYVYEYSDPDPQHPRPNHMTGARVVEGGIESYQNKFNYNIESRLETASEGPAGRSIYITYTYDPALGEYTTVKEWIDLDWDLQIDDGGQVVESKYYYERPNDALVIVKTDNPGCACSSNIEYDEMLRPTSKTDNRGVSSTMQYDVMGNIISLVEAVGTPEEKVTTYTYLYREPPYEGQILEKRVVTSSVANPGGNKTTVFTYDSLTGKLITSREEGFLGDLSQYSYMTTYAYTSSGAIRSIDGPLPGTADTITYEYYPNGLLWKIIEANGATTIFLEYDGLGNVLQKTDPNGVLTTQAYDARGRMSSQTVSNGATQYTTLYTYDAEGNIETVTYPKGNVTGYEHDSLGRQTRISDEFGNHMDYIYSGGNMTREEVYDHTGQLKKYVDHQYDDNHRLLKTYYPNGTFDELEYDNNGNVTKKNFYSSSNPDVLQKSTTQDYDSLNRLKSVTVTGDPYAVSYEYDSHDNMKKVTDPINQQTLYAHDDMGRIFRVTSPETGITEYTFDATGNMLIKNDNLQRVTSYAYDSLSRLTGITYPDATPSVLYRYDNYSEGSAPNAVGRLTEVTDRSGFKRLYYDYAGRVIRMVYTMDGRAFVTEYGYDANGNLESITYPEGRVIQYIFYPQSNQVESVKMIKDGIETILAQGIARMPFGPVSSFNLGNGIQSFRDYDNPSYRLASLMVTGPGGYVLGPWDYLPKPNGNIESITKHLTGGGTEVHTYDYDLMDRLKMWNKDGSLTSFDYDANGNRTVRNAIGQITNYQYVTSAPNILEGTTGAEANTYTHDPIGNIIGWGMKTFGFDATGRMTAAEEDGLSVGSYIYNIDGQRAKKQAGDAVTYFVYDLQGRILHEYRNGGTYVVDYIYLGDEPLAMVAADIPPTILSGPSATVLTRTQVTVNWSTDGLSDSRVLYGVTTAYGLESYQSALVANHAVILSGLALDVTYHYKVISRDGFGNLVESSNNTFIIVNHAPTAFDQATSTSENIPLPIVLGAADPENDPLTYILVSSPLKGTLNWTPPEVTYTPNLNYFGSDSFTFKVNDGLVDSNIATVSITINPVPKIIDNSDTTYPDWFMIVSGTWQIISSPLGGYYGTNYVTRNAPHAGERVRFNPYIVVPGWYKMYLWWPVPNTNFSTVSPFEVIHANGTTALYVNQQIGGGAWKYIGRYYFNAGKGFIRLTDSAADGKKVLADAVKWEWDANQGLSMPQGSSIEGAVVVPMETSIEDSLELIMVPNQPLAPDPILPAPPGKEKK